MTTKPPAFLSTKDPLGTAVGGSAAASSNTTVSGAIPAGFVALPLHGGFMTAPGPLYGRRDGDFLCMGFRVEERHINPNNVCHGGMLMLFADMQMAMAARAQTDVDDEFFPTINLTTDFLAPAPLGTWVHGRCDVMRVTRNMLFMQGVIFADDKPVARINGIFKRGGKMPGDGGMVDMRSIFGFIASDRQ